MEQFIPSVLTVVVAFNRKKKQKQKKHTDTHNGREKKKCEI